MRELVILVPGIGLGGIELSWLRYLLTKAGYEAHIFYHFPWHKDLLEKSSELSEFSFTFNNPNIHYVCHGIGGLITLNMISNSAKTMAGRIVTIGTAHNGSLAVQHLLSLAVGKYLVSPCSQSAHRLGSIPMPKNCQVGAIAGKLNIVFGHLLGLDSPNDTIVSVTETHHPQLTDFMQINLSHGSMLLSNKVARNVVNFLQCSRFVDNA